MRALRTNGQTKKTRFSRAASVGGWRRDGAAAVWRAARTSEHAARNIGVLPMASELLYRGGGGGGGGGGGVGEEDEDCADDHLLLGERGELDREVHLSGGGAARKRRGIRRPSEERNRKAFRGEESEERNQEADGVEVEGSWTRGAGERRVAGSRAPLLLSPMPQRHRGEA